MLPHKKPTTEAEARTVYYMKEFGRMNEETTDWPTMYVSPDQFLCKHGLFWGPGERPDGIEMGEPGLAYRNAFVLATESEGVTYCEGVVLVDHLRHLCFQHGWCVDNRGVVVDPTLGRPGAVYFGVAFTFRHVIDATSMYGCCLHPEYLLDPDESVIERFPFKKKPVG